MRMHKVFVDPASTHGIVFIEDIDKFLEGFEWSKVMVQKKYLTKLTGFLSDFTEAIDNNMSNLTENKVIEIIAAKDKERDQTILLAKPMSVSGLYFVIAGVIDERDLADEDEEADAE